MTVIKIDDEIGMWGITASMVSRQLNEASGDITVEISSPGGAVFEGIAIFNAIKSYDKGHVTTVITSLAASMASIIALAGDTVKAFDNAVYMIHNASQWVGGDARFLRKRADHLESLTNLMAKIYMSKSGKAEAEIKRLLDEETFFYGSEMLDAGFIDELITTEIGGDQASALALAKESFDSCMMHYRENAKEEDNDQAAAILKTLGVNPASAKIKIQNKENTMEYSKESFEALKAENAEALKTATASAVAAEKDRVSGIMALGANAEFTKNAIDGNMSVGDAAIALIGSQRESMQKQKMDFEKGAEEVAELAEGEKPDEELSAEAKMKKEADEAIENYGKGK